MVRVQRSLPRRRLTRLGSVSLRRDFLSEAFCSKLDLLSHEIMTPLKLSSHLWSFCTETESDLGLSFREVFHLSGWRGFVNVSQRALL